MAKINIAATSTGVESVVSQFDKLSASERRVVVEAMKASGAVKEAVKPPNAGPMESMASGLVTKIGGLAAAWLSVNKIMGEVDSTLANMQARQDSSMDKFKSYRAAYGSLLLNNPILSTPGGSADKQKIDEFIASRAGKIGGEAPQAELAGAIRDVRSMTGEATTDQQLAAIDAAIQAKKLAPENVDLAKTAVNLVKAQQKTPGMSSTQAQNVLFATGSLAGGDIANLSQNMIPLYTLVNEQNMRAPIQDVMSAFALGTNKIGDEMGNETVTMVTNLFSRELQSGKVKIGKRKMSFSSENLLDRLTEMLAEIDRQATEEAQKSGTNAGENLRARLTKQLATQLGGRGAMGVNYLMSLDRARKNIVDPQTGETELGMYRRRIGEAKTAAGESYAELGMKNVDATLDAGRFKEAKQEQAAATAVAIQDKKAQEAAFWRKRLKEQSAVYGIDWDVTDKYLSKKVVTADAGRSIYNERMRNMARTSVSDSAPNVLGVVGSFLQELRPTMPIAYESRIKPAEKDPRFRNAGQEAVQQENERRIVELAIDAGSFSPDKSGYYSTRQLGLLNTAAQMTGIPVPKELTEKNPDPQRREQAVSAFRYQVLKKLRAPEELHGSPKSMAPEASGSLPAANGTAPVSAPSGQLSLSLDPASIKAITDGLASAIARDRQEQANAIGKSVAMAMNERNQGTAFGVPTFLEQETA